MADLGVESSSVEDDLAVVLLGPTTVAARVAARVAWRAVVATDAGELAGELAGVAGAAAAVVGVAVEPWPAYAAAHDRVRAAVAPAPYYAVQSWHQHPTYLERLADALTAARALAGGDVHVLFTAPGPAGEVEPGDVVFLRETGQALSEALGVARRSIAWTSGGLGPSSLLALTALAEAHGRPAVVRCSLDPLARPDDVATEAASLGLDLVEATLDPGDVPGMVDDVVATVAEHERLVGGQR